MTTIKIPIGDFNITYKNSKIIWIEIADGPRGGEGIEPGEETLKKLNEMLHKFWDATF